MKKEKRAVSDALSANKITRLVRKDKLRVVVFDEIDSTNTEARREAEGGDSTPALILANAQSAGRGRMGRSFFSPPATGLYMSLLLEAKAELADTVRMTTAAAVAVASAIEELCCIEVGIKWVNDVYFGGRKICGILCESFVCGGGKRYAVVGIGINLYTEEFPDEIKGRAASLFPHEGIRNALAAAIARKLFEFWEAPEDERIIEYYRVHSIVLGKRVIFTEGGVEREGTALSVDGFGALRVRTDEGEERMLTGGEISLRAVE